MQTDQEIPLYDFLKTINVKNDEIIEFVRLQISFLIELSEEFDPANKEATSKGDRFVAHVAKEIAEKITSCDKLPGNINESGLKISPQTIRRFLKKDQMSTNSDSKADSAHYASENTLRFLLGYLIEFQEVERSEIIDAIEKKPIFNLKTGIALSAMIPNAEIDKRLLGKFYAFHHFGDEAFSKIEIRFSETKNSIIAANISHNFYDKVFLKTKHRDVLYKLKKNMKVDNELDVLQEIALLIDNNELPPLENSLSSNGNLINSDQLKSVIFGNGNGKLYGILHLSEISQTDDKFINIQANAPRETLNFLIDKSVKPENEHNLSGHSFVFNKKIIKKKLSNKVKSKKTSVGFMSINQIDVEKSIKSQDLYVNNSNMKDEFDKLYAKAFPERAGLSDQEIEELLEKEMSEDPEIQAYIARRQAALDATTSPTERMWFALNWLQPDVFKQSIEDGADLNALEPSLGIPVMHYMGGQSMYRYINIVLDKLKEDPSIVDLNVRDHFGHMASERTNYVGRNCDLAIKIQKAEVKQMVAEGIEHPRNIIAMRRPDWVTVPHISYPFARPNLD